MSKNTGKIVQVIGPVVDVAFENGELPQLLTAIEIPLKDSESLIVEVAQHIGDERVRCIAMGGTDGLVRGMEAIDTGSAIRVPVGKEILGRMFNVLGREIDGLGPVGTDNTLPIHRQAPGFEEQQTSAEMLETGIKVIDLLCPYSKPTCSESSFLPWGATSAPYSKAAYSVRSGFTAGSATVTAVLSSCIRSK